MSQSKRVTHGRFGLTVGDITPEIGIRMRNWGAAQYEVAGGIHHPLSARVLTFEPSGGGKLLVLVVLDWGWWRSASHELAFRTTILNRLGLREEQLMIHLTHTHAGPSIDPDETDLPGGSRVPPYLAKTIETVIALVETSRSEMKSGTLEESWAPVDLARNRDSVFSGQSVVGCVPSSKRPPDEESPRAWVGRIFAGQTLAGLIVHYPCHPTTLAWENDRISPDYPGGARQILASELCVPCLFLQGASGEFGPEIGFVGDPEIADNHGKRLGYSVLAHLAGLPPFGHQWSAETIVASGANLLPTSIQPILEDSVHSGSLSQSNSTVLRIPLDWSDNQMLQDDAPEFVKSERALRRSKMRAGLPAEEFELPIWVWELGNLILVGLPIEAYQETERAIAEGCSGRTILFLNVTNGWLGYLPPDRFFDQPVYAVAASLFCRKSEGRVQRAIKEFIHEEN